MNPEVGDGAGKGGNLSGVRRTRLETGGGEKAVYIRALIT